ncbi:transposase [Streptomyces sp. NPDC006649]|uniref:transposase n=1 Tax=Streptomyces sp. NPDC006649 TaxID=3156896 RepID=UPI0033A01DBC
MPSDDKVQLVLAVLGGQTTASQAARDAGVTEQSIGNWRRQFIAAGKRGLEAGSSPSKRERQLLSEINELKAALGEAFIQLKAGRAALDARAIPTQTSRPYGPRGGSAFRGSAASLGSPDRRTAAAAIRFGAA